MPNREAELLSEIEYLNGVIKKYEAKEAENAERIADAERQAKEIVDAAERLYNLEADRLRLFRLAWDKKFAAASDKKSLERLNELALKIDEVISLNGKYADLDFKAKTEELRRIVGEDGKLISGDPIFVGDGEEGFSLDEILNPKGGQDLAEMLKEMGITEE